MFRLAWITDPHLLHAGKPGMARLAKHIELAEPDYLVVSGDIADAGHLTESLEALASMCQCPMGFVLGNHDYYGSSRAKVRAEVRAFCGNHAAIQWLPLQGVVSLTAKTALVGVDGWADGRNGAGIHGTPINDFYAIEDLRWNSVERMRTLARFSDEETVVARRLLVKALKIHEEVIFATHVPPFKESAWHEGAMSEPAMLPWFSSRGMGEMLLDLMGKYPDRRCRVLCGHTHGGGVYRPLPNLEVVTGAAEYGDPVVQEVLFLDEERRDRTAEGQTSERDPDGIALSPDGVLDFENSPIHNRRRR